MRRENYRQDNRIKALNAERVLGKTLPHNLEAEKSVLGAILLNDENLRQVSELLIPDDFYDLKHRVIYKTILECSKKFNRIDMVTLQDELKKSGKLDDIGGIVYLVSLQEDIPTMGLVQQHSQIIREKSLLRELIKSATGIITNCYSQDEENISIVLDEAEKTIFQISNKRTSQSFVQLNIWLKKTFQHLSDIKGNSKGITGVPSGYSKLDKMSSGFQNGDFVVLAARPSMGKTALSLSMIAHAAASGYPVGLFSLEMSAEQLTLRLLSAESSIALYNIRNATITSE